MNLVSGISAKRNTVYGRRSLQVGHDSICLLSKFVRVRSEKFRLCCFKLVVHYVQMEIDITLF
jgi:hypothetical protein